MKAKSNVNLSRFGRLAMTAALMIAPAAAEAVKDRPIDRTALARSSHVTLPPPAHCTTAGDLSPTRPPALVYRIDPVHERSILLPHTELLVGPGFQNAKFPLLEVSNVRFAGEAPARNVINVPPKCLGGSGIEIRVLRYVA